MTTAAVPAASLRVKLSALPTGWQVIRYRILSDNRLAVLSTNVDLATEHLRSQAASLTSSTYDHTRLHALAAEGTARVWISGPTGWTEALSFPLESPYPTFDRFKDGRWLVVNSGTQEDCNARVLSPDGATLARFKLGYGVNHLGIDASDVVWVGWTDEGIFGNGDWAVPGLEWPPSSYGVACFDPNGRFLPRPEWPDAAGDIAHCYALNVSGQCAWACPYTEFPLVCFDKFKPDRWWRSKLGGPVAIAMNETHVLVAGGYTEHANRLTLVTLGEAGRGEDVTELATWALPLLRLPPPATKWAPIWRDPDLLDGRGDTLHLIDEGLWQCWRVADLLAAL